MAVIDQIGTTLSTGAGTITGSYIVERRVNGAIDVGLSDINDENGALKTRLILHRWPTIELDLICIDGALPETDFPEGNIATHADFTSYYVDSAPVTKIGGEERVSVKLTNLGIT